MALPWFPDSQALRASPYPLSVWILPKLFLHTYPPLLRRCWADWRKELYEESLRRFRRCHWNEKTIFPFALQISSFKSTGSSKTGLSTFTENKHHNISCFVPFSIGFAYVSSVIFLFWSRPRKGPMPLCEFASIIRNIKRIRNTIFSIALSSLSMSFYIDMKMILLWQCSGSHLMSVIIISASISNVVNPKKIFHSNSVDSTISLYGRDSINQLTFSFHALTGSWLMPPIHSTESEETEVFAVANWTAPCQ